MEPFSPLVIGLAIITGLFLVSLLLLDRRRVRASNRVGLLMKTFVITHAMKPISVVITLESDDDRIWSTLAHLQAIDYAHLQVVIIAGPEVGQAFVRRLRQYQRKNKTLKMTVASRKINASERPVILRHAKGDALFFMRPGEQVSDNCFRRLSVELLDESVDSFSVNEFPSVDDSLRSATHALDVITRMILPRGREESRIFRTDVYKKNAIGSQSFIVDISVVSPYVSRTLSTGLSATVVLAVATTAATISAIWFPTIGQLITAALYTVMILVVAMIVASSPYRSTIKAPLLTLLPLWPLVSALDSISLVAKRILRQSWPKRLRHKTTKNPAL